MPGNGLILLTPTSVSASGGSASIGANGSVSFAGTSALTINGVFNSTYSNYRVILSISSNSTPTLNIRMASGGTGNADASSYKTQKLNIYQGQAPARSSSSIAEVTTLGTSPSIVILDFFYPGVDSTPTSIRCYNAMGYSNASAFDASVTHSVTNAFDGFLWTTLSAFTCTGRLAVYGMRG